MMDRPKKLEEIQKLQNDVNHLHEKLFQSLQMTAQCASSDMINPLSTIQLQDL